MSFNIIEELQEVDSKSPPLTGKWYEYNHSKRQDYFLQYTINANMEKAQCTIGFGHPMWVYPSSSPHHYNGMHSIYNAEGVHHLLSFRDIDFSLVSKIVKSVPLDVKSLATGTVLVTVTKKSLK